MFKATEQKFAIEQGTNRVVNNVVWPRSSK